jgi:hypothetical protein
MTTTFPRSPKLLKGQLISVDPGTLQVQSVIEFQYNPDTVTRRVDARTVGGENSDKTEVLRLGGPPKETITLSGVEFDCSDQLEQNEQHARQLGLYPVLSALELLVYPDLKQLQKNAGLAMSGNIEIIPPEAPMTLFVWGPSRVLPVRLTGFNITEEACDTELNPIRAKVDLTLQVLSTADFQQKHAGYSLFETHHSNKVSLAGHYREAGAERSGMGLHQYLRSLFG